jgi:hypothetical protein
MTTTPKNIEQTASFLRSAKRESAPSILQKALSPIVGFHRARRPMTNVSSSAISAEGQK